MALRRSGRGSLSTARPKRNQHRDLLAISVVSAFPQLAAKETFLEPGLDPKSDPQDQYAGDSERGAQLRCGRRASEHDAGVDRVAYDGVWPCIDDAMIGLLGHRTRPQASKVEPSPTSERHARQDDQDERVIDNGLKGP